MLRAAARTVTAEYPQASIDVQVTNQYRNMADGLKKEPRAVSFAEEAMRRAGLEPKLTIVRGGTDGSRLTELGLPTPNLSCGEHNLHSPLEWTCLEEMATAVRVLIELAQVWGESDQPPERGRRRNPPSSEARKADFRDSLSLHAGSGNDRPLPSPPAVTGEADEAALPVGE